MLDKKYFREKMLNIRNNLDNNFVVKNSNIIQNNLLNIDEYINSKSIYIYMDINNEVNTKQIILNALDNNKKVAIPKISNNIMNFYYIQNINQVKKGYFNILEPTTNDIALDDNSLIILPGIVFSKSKNRIGYGKGFYDKYLSVNNKNIKIALCYDFQIIDSIPHTKNDIPLDIIITEKRIIK